MSRIIPDKAVKELTTTTDFLGTKKYSEHLKSIIESLKNKELNKGFNIGLFGSWGSGKTSITNDLGKSLCKNDFKYVHFDVWKYSTDDLRRSFLLELCKSLGLTDLTKDFEDKFYNSIELNSFQGIKELIFGNLGLVATIIITFLGIALIEPITTYIASKQIVCNRFYLLGSITAGLFTSVGILIGDKLLDRLNSSTKQTSIIHSIFSVEQFEKLFQKALQVYKDQECNICGLKKNENIKKIIITFDNIDRCSPDIVLELLKSIKTFFNQENCIFIIPLDYDSTCRIFENNDGDEYLRKIFNLGIHILEPGGFVKTKLVKKLFIHWDQNEVLKNVEKKDIIAKKIGVLFGKNPRKIIQFINKLGSEYLLFHKNDKEKREITGILKHLVYQQEISQVYNWIVENPDFYQEQELKIVNTSDFEDYKSKLYNEHYEAINFGINEYQYLLIRHLSDDDIKIDRRVFTRIGVIDDYSSKFNEDYYQPEKLIKKLIDKEEIANYKSFLEDKASSIDQGSGGKERDYLTSNYFLLALKEKELFKLSDFKNKIYKEPIVHKSLGLIYTQDAKRLYERISLIADEKELLQELFNYVGDRLPKLNLNNYNSSSEFILEVLNKNINNNDVCSALSGFLIDEIIEKGTNEYSAWYESLTENEKARILKEHHLIEKSNVNQTPPRFNVNLIPFLGKHGNLYVKLRTKAILKIKASDNIEYIESITKAFKDLDLNDIEIDHIEGLIGNFKSPIPEKDFQKNLTLLSFVSHFRELENKNIELINFFKEDDNLEEVNDQIINFWYKNSCYDKYSLPVKKIYEYTEKTEKSINKEIGVKLILKNAISFGDEENFNRTPISDIFKTRELTKNEELLKISRNLLGTKNMLKFGYHFISFSDYKNIISDSKSVIKKIKKQLLINDNDTNDVEFIDRINFVNEHGLIDSNYIDEHIDLITSKLLTILNTKTSTGKESALQFIANDHNSNIIGRIKNKPNLEQRIRNSLRYGSTQASQKMKQEAINKMRTYRN